MDESKLLGFEDARKEADLMENKMGENNKLSYSEAEGLVNREQIVEGAKDGTLAKKIRSLDLSKDEDVEKLKEQLSILTRQSREQKILDENGREMFSMGQPDVDTIEKGLVMILEHISKTKLIDNLSIFDTSARNSLYGHYFGHLATHIRANLIYILPSENDRTIRREGAIKSEHGSDKFISAIANMTFVISRTFCGSFSSEMIIAWSKGKKEGKISDDVIKNHPNYSSIAEMGEKADKFFLTLKEVFMKYLSNVIQDPNYVVSGESLNMNLEQTKEAVEYYYNQHHDLMGDNLALKPRIAKVEEEVESVNLATTIKAETDWFIRLLDQYQKVLEEYDSKMNYAKPQE